MSDAQAKKGKSHKAQGWEDAGGDFYQENYCSDWDGLPKNPTFAITTLLPSKQNRFGTRRRNPQSCPPGEEGKPGKFWQTFTSNTHNKTCKQNDIQFSVLPDLSQVLTDEERIWEEILQIKHMPVSMQQKKDLKNSLQSATKLRLQGFNNFKWKHRKAWKKCCVQWSKFIRKLELWQSSLKHIEGHFGTGVVAYFLFLRWLFFLNCISFLFIMVFIILPNLYLYGSVLVGDGGNCPPNEDCQHDMMNHNLSILDVVQGSGILKSSLMFYGAYSNATIYSDGRHCQHKESSFCMEEEGDSTSSSATIIYDLALSYIFVAVAYLCVALVAIVRGAAREFKDRLINGKWQFYQFCNLVFGGWDFCIHNEKSGQIKYKAIFNEVKCILQSKRIEIERNNRSKMYMYTLICTRIMVNMAILTILFISAYIIYFLFNISMNHQSMHSQYAPGSTVANNTNDDGGAFPPTGFSNGDESSVEQKIADLFFDFMPFIAIVCLNLFLPIIFNYLCQFEKYSPLFIIKISLFRTVFLRLASLAVLLSRFYFIVVPKTHKNSTSAYPCWETFVGQQFYKLVLTDFVSHIVVTFCVNLPRSLFARTFEQSFIKFIGEQEFELSKHVLDVVYIQTICWLGSFYCPILPALVAVIMFCMFYVKKFQCLINSRPSRIFYGSSRSNSLFMLILLLSFFTALMPIIYGIAEVRPSVACGPFRGLTSVWDAPVEAFMKLPVFLKDIFFFFGTAGFAIPCFIVLTLLLYYFYAVSDANRNMVEVLKNQLVLEGHDKQFLLTRLSYFLKQHHAPGGMAGDDSSIVPGPSGQFN